MHRVRSLLRADFRMVANCYDVLQVAFRL